MGGANRSLVIEAVLFPRRGRAIYDVRPFDPMNPSAEGGNPRTLRGGSGTREAHWNSRSAWGDLAMVPSDWALRSFVGFLRRGNSIAAGMRMVRESAREQNSKLADAALGMTLRLCEKVARTGLSHERVPRILEVGFGIADLTVLLLPEVKRRGWVYSGVDCSPKMLEKARCRLLSVGLAHSDVARLRIGLADELDCVEDQPFSVVVWGKLGLHLVLGAGTSRSEWNKALSQVKTILEPGGYFMLYEPLVEGNPRYYEKPWRKKWTLIRSEREYTEALHPLVIETKVLHEFCDEAYTIAAFGQTSG